MSDTSEAMFGAALGRWVKALNAQGLARLVEAAVAPDALVERYGYGPDAGRLVELIEGRESVRRWAALTPSAVSFALAGPVSVVPEPEGPVGEARYRLAALDFVNGGAWRFRLDAGGRIAWLRHMPDDIEGAVREHRDPHPADCDADHDHDHEALDTSWRRYVDDPPGG